MPRLLSLLLMVVLGLASVVPATAQAQRLADARLAVSTKSSASAPVPLAVRAESAPPLWPFILLGAVGGAVYASTWYADRVREADGWGNVAVAAVAIGAGTVGGALSGAAIGLIVRRIAR